MRDKQKVMTAEQLWIYALRSLSRSNGYYFAPILQYLRIGPLPTFDIPTQPFKRRALERQRRGRAKQGSNFRQIQGERYGNPTLMALHRSSNV